MQTPLFSKRPQIGTKTHGTAGPPTTTKDSILETGSLATQSFEPLKAVCAHMNAFHVYASDQSRIVEENHYCTHISADVPFSLTSPLPLPSTNPPRSANA